LPEVWLLGGLLFVATGFVLCPDAWFKSSDTTVSFLHHLSHEGIHGHLNGEFSGHRSRFPIASLEPGDILLFHNRNGAYGYWTHAAVYAGGGQAVDSYDFTEGTRLTPVGAYQNYDKTEVLRVKATKYVRLAAAAMARRQVGVPYDPFEPLSDRHSQYCSKLVWVAYEAEGVTLCRQKAWVVPDDLAKSPLVAVLSVRDRSESSS